MPFPPDAGDLAARARLADIYNGGDYDAGTNAGGLARGGHRVNFEPALQDVATVAAAVADAAEAAEGSATAAAVSETNALAAAEKLVATSSTSRSIGTGSKAFTTQSGKLFAVGAFVLIRSAANPTTNFMQGQVTAYSGASLTVNVLVATGSGAYTDWLLQVSASPGEKGGQGDLGPAGVTPNTQMQFSNGTGDSDPGNGLLKLNNATLASVTRIYIDDLDRFGTSIASFIATFDDSTNTDLRGQIKLVQVGSPEKYAIFNITGANIAGSGYTKLVVVFASGPGGFDNLAYLAIDFTRTGDKGLDGTGAGDIVGPASSTDGHVMLFEGATGKRAKSGGPLAAVATNGLASSVAVMPVGSLGSSSVQAALAELDDEKQPIDGLLTALAALTTASGKAPYFTGPDAVAMYDTTSTTRGLMASPSTAAFRASLLLESANRRRNRIVNGAMTVNQVATATLDLTTSTGYALDQWMGALSTTPGGTLRLQQVASVTPGGSPNRLRATVQVADSSLAAGDSYVIQQPIEGIEVADFRFGSASAKQVVLSFGCRSSVAGTFGVSYINAAGDRSWIGDIVIAGGEINTDLVRTLVIPGDTTGTWLTTETLAAMLRITLAAGSNFTGVAGWNAANYSRTSSQTNFMATGSATFELFDVGLYRDGDALGVAPLWEFPDPSVEKIRCKRFDRLTTVGLRATLAAGTVLAQTIPFDVPMRGPPTMSYFSGSTASNVTTVSVTAAGDSACLATILAASSADTYILNYVYRALARLA